ncbi:response regulator transcription factor [Kitasatospora sp. NPDC048540]
MLETKSKIRVVVGDDHPIYREALVRLLSTTTTVVAEAGDGRAALTAIREHRPDVAVLDYQMPMLDGGQVAARVRHDGLPTKIMVVSASNEPSVVYRALQQGVVGYLTKCSDPTKILDGVEACSRGETVVPHELTSGLVEEIQKRADQVRTVLTERERQVLTMVADGVPISQIASVLFLAPTTVKADVQRICQKLGVTGRGAMVAEAMRRGLLD